MRKKFRCVTGFSLVEIAVALAVASFCLVTLLALLPIGIQHYHDADAQSAMVNVATMVVRDLETTPSSGTSPRFGFTIPAGGGSASGTTPQTVYVDASSVPSGTGPGAAPVSSSIYRISVFFFPPPTVGQRVATGARIWITFPAHADPSPTSSPANYADMFETTVSLNRN